MKDIDTFKRDCDAISKNSFEEKVGCASVRALGFEYIKEGNS